MAAWAPAEAMTAPMAAGEVMDASETPNTTMDVAEAVRSGNTSQQMMTSVGTVAPCKRPMTPVIAAAAQSGIGTSRNTRNSAAELSSALFSSGSAAALELAPVFADIASGKLTAIELAVAGSQASAATGPIVIGELSIDLASRTVKVSDAPVSLTPKEFDILAFLASNRGTVFSKEEIYRAVWQNEYLLDDSNIMAFVRKIRKKIEPEPDNPHYLLTVWGVGYKMAE